MDMSDRQAFDLLDSAPTFDDRRAIAVALATMGHRVGFFPSSTTPARATVVTFYWRDALKAMWDERDGDVRVYAGTFSVEFRRRAGDEWDAWTVDVACGLFDDLDTAQHMVDDVRDVRAAFPDSTFVAGRVRHSPVKCVEYDVQTPLRPHVAGVFDVV